MVDISNIDFPQKVLNAIIRNSEGLQLSVEMYHNSPESGFALVDVMNYRRNHPAMRKKIVFSQYGGSQLIVVYFGTCEDFATLGNIPNERAYLKKSIFPSSRKGIKDAANNITHYFWTKETI